MQMNNMPIGWSFKRVQDMGRVITGSTPPMSDKDNYGNEFCWATAQDFKSKYIDDTVVKLSNKGKTLSRVLPAGSVLVTCIASIGLNAIAKTEMATNQQINAIIPNDDFCSDFLYYLFCYNTDKLKQYAGGGGILILSKGEFEKIRFMVPAVKEQKKIAEILGTWDRAIEELTGLIAEKKELRKGLANRLLNGLMWQDVELSDLLNYEQPTKYLVTEILDYDVQKIPVLTANKAFILGSTDDTIGVYSKQDCIIFDDFTTDMKYVDFNFKVKSSAIKILTPKENVNLKFVFEQMQRLKLPIGGHKRYWLSEYQYLTIKMPNEDTQSKIVSILSRADAEIDLLNQQLNVLREQKRGLMQKLLTGEIRVKVDTDEQ